MTKINWAFLLGCLSLLSAGAFAGSPYFGPTFFIQNNTLRQNSYQGFHPRLSAGYWGSKDCFYLAGELTLVPFDVQISESDNDRAVSVRTTTQYGLTFIPGLFVTENVIAYLRLGYNTAHFYGPDSNYSGPQLGVGLQSILSENWSIRLEYIYTAYSNISGLGSPQSDEYGLGLIYKLQ